jgi:hypothetical protein
MATTEQRAVPDTAAQRMRGVLLLLIVGGGLVVADVDVDGLHLVPDVLGYAVLSVAGVRLAGVPATDPRLRQQLQRAGAALCALAAVEAIGWLAQVTGLRAPAQEATGMLAWFDALLLAASVAVGVAVLVTLARWCADRGLAHAQAQLHRAAHAVGWPWGAAALLGLFATAVLDGPRLPASVEAPWPWVLGLMAMGLLVTIAYAAWTLWSVRKQIRFAGGR